MADYNTEQRRKMASTGAALPGGRYPIRNESDLRNAIHALGRAKGGASGRAVVKRFIIRRARALGLTSVLPDDWK
jgi:hypothetical protein